MRESVPSRTALRVALRRAAHQLVDSPRVLDDPLAVPIVGEAIAEIQGSPAKQNTRTARHFRAFMVARSRLAEDQLAACIARGVSQYLILGAGLDTSAFRGVALHGVQAFEVDHPSTQAWKRHRLEAAAISIPPSVRFVAVNFERQELEDELHKSGFRSDRPAFVSWLGVVPYLTREAARHTLLFLGRLPAGSGVVFDYAVSRSALRLLERMALDALSRRVARAGEPFRLFFTPEELRRFLTGLGFRKVEQLSQQDINALYFSHRTDGLSVAGAAERLVTEWT